MHKDVCLDFTKLSAGIGVVFRFNGGDDGHHAGIGQVQRNSEAKDIVTEAVETGFLVSLRQMTFYLEGDQLYSFR